MTAMPDFVMKLNTIQKSYCTGILWLTEHKLLVLVIGHKLFLIFIKICIDLFSRMWYNRNQRKLRRIVGLKAKESSLSIYRRNEVKASERSEHKINTKYTLFLT